MDEKKLVLRSTESKIANVYTPKGKDMLALLQSCVAGFYQRYSKMPGKDESNHLVHSICKRTDKLVL